jgi:hypothetical protein
MDRSNYTKVLMEQIKHLEKSIKDIDPELKEANKYKMIDSYGNRLLPLKLKKKGLKEDLKRLRKKLAGERKRQKQAKKFQQATMASGRTEKKKRRRTRQTTLKEMTATERAERDRSVREARAKRKVRAKAGFKDTKTRGPTGDPDDPLYIAGLGSQRGKYNKSQANKIRREKKAIDLERAKLQREKDSQNPIFSTNPLTNQERRRRGGTSLDRAFGQGTINQGQDTISRTPEPPPPTATTREDLKDWRGRIKVIKKGVLGAPLSASDALSQDLDYELLPPEKLSEELKKLKKDMGGRADSISEGALKREATKLGLISRLEDFGLRVAPSVRKTQTQTGLGQADKIRVSNLPEKEFRRRDLSKNIVEYRGGSEGSKALQRLERANRNRANFDAIRANRKSQKVKPAFKSIQERYQKARSEDSPASSRYKSDASSSYKRLTGGLDIVSEDPLAQFRVETEDPLAEFRVKDIPPEKRKLKLKPKKEKLISTTFDDIFEGAIRRIKDKPDAFERDEETGKFLNPMIEEEFQKELQELEKEKQDLQAKSKFGSIQEEEEFVDVKGEEPEPEPVDRIPSSISRAPRKETPETAVPPRPILRLPQPKPPILRLPQTEVQPKPTSLSEGSDEEVFSRGEQLTKKKEPEPEPPEPQPEPPSQSQKRYSTNPRQRSISEHFTPEVKRMAIEGEDKLKEMKQALQDKHKIPKKYFAKASTKKEKDEILQRVNNYLINMMGYTANSVAYNEAMRQSEDIINQALINQRFKSKTPKTNRRRGQRRK